MKDIKILLKKRKIKSANILMNNIGIFLKKGKTKTVNMVANDKKPFMKMKDKSQLSMENIILIYRKIKSD